MLKVAFRLGRGEAMRDIGSSINRSPTTVYNIKTRATDDKEYLEIFDYTRAILAHFVAFCLFTNPQASGRSISEQALAKLHVETSRSTVNRLSQEMHFDAVLQQKQEKLTQSQKDYRVYFCAAVRLWWGYGLAWVFTDECMLVLNPVKRRLRVLRGLDTPEKFVEVSGYPTKVMVWGCIGRDFRGPLLRISGNLDAIAYQKLLQHSEIFEKLKDRYGTAQSFVFQQDGARPHTAKSTQAFLAPRAITLPKDTHWPANSPDLSVIENLWGIVKRQVDYSVVTDADSLYEEAKRVWESVDLQTINKLIKDFDPRLKACVALRGECLNRYKAVLRGFRISSRAGETAVEELRQKEQKILQFKAESDRLFNDQRCDVLPPADSSTFAEAQEKERRNRRFWLDSCRICRLLPGSVLQRCRLPFQPKLKKRLPRPLPSPPDHKKELIVSDS